MDLPYEKQFHFHDGTSIGDLEQLKRKIESISYQEFYRHVNAQKNDFAAWIRYVLRDERLADDLQKVTSIVETVEIINDYLHPRPVEVPRSDMQSKIEVDLLKPSGDLVIEQVPTVNPSPAKTDEIAELPVIEEKAQEELFGRPQPAPQQPAGSAQTSDHASDHEMSQFVVKEFIFGIIFGLLVGVILGLMLAV